MKRIKNAVRIIKMLLFIVKEKKRLQVDIFSLLLAVKQELLMYDPEWSYKFLGSRDEY